ncbi:MAG: hypothetical protein H7X97_11885 [Opitutaceae bacterium]|nr:hypothetical protein [Verrucomicrobiales bacterium]
MTSAQKLSAGVAILAFLLAGQPRTHAAETSWRISTFAGNGTAGHSGDSGPATNAQLNNPFGIVRGPDGAIYFCEYDGNVVRRVDARGVITTVAGSGKKGYSGDGGPAIDATFNQPHEIRFDQGGNLFIVDMLNSCIRRVDAKTKVITTVAGTGQSGYSGDGGPARMATFNQPHSIQFDPQENLFVCDVRNHVIRRIDGKSGMITTIVGTGKPGPTPDGDFFSTAPLNGPRTIDFGPDGNLWVALREGNQVYRLDLKAGTIHHVAGTGKKGFDGNGSPAKGATLSGPKGLAIAPIGDIYLVDTESHSIRMIEAKTGLLRLIAGTGVKGDGPDGDPLQCKLARPHGIWADADGAIFIGDSENHRIRVLRKIP